MTDNNYVKLIKDTISFHKTDLAKLEDKGLKWDLIKMHCRAETIKFASKKKREKTKLEDDITTELNRLQENKNTSSPDYNTEILTLKK